jgi:ketosteroid isomerase-like protein
MNQEIINLLKAYEKALNTSDTQAAMALYGSDPIFMPEFSVALIGRDTVKAGYDKVFEAITLNVVFTIHEIVEAGDWAYARTSSAGETRIHASAKMVKEGNNELFIFRKEKGQWKIHRYLFATTNPASA